MSHWYQSIYFNLFMVLIIIIFPLYMTQFFTNQWGIDATTSELNSAAYSNVVYLRDHFVDNIKLINVQLEYLLVNSNITEFTVWEYYSAIKNITNLLSLVKNSNPYINEMTLYYPTYNVAVSSDKRVDILKSDVITKMINEFRDQHTLLFVNDEQIVVGHMAPSTAYFKEELPQYFVLAFLSEVVIKNHLSSFSQYSNKNALMITHNSGTVVTSKDYTLGATDLSAILALITPQNSETVYSTSINLNDQSYIVVACYSKIINSSFAQLILAEKLQTIPNRFRLFMNLFLVLALAVVGLFLLIMYRLEKSNDC